MIIQFLCLTYPFGKSIAEPDLGVGGSKYRMKFHLQPYDKNGFLIVLTLSCP